MTTRLDVAEVRRLFTYDPATGELRWRVPSGTRAAGDSAGTLRTTGYITVCYRGKGYVVHRLAWVLVHGNWPTGQIDHINRNKQDNRLANLRDVSGYINQQNQFAPRARNKLRIRGVSKARNRFQAKIYAEGRQVFIGSFATAEEAQQAYLAAKRKYHPDAFVEVNA